MKRIMCDYHPKRVAVEERVWMAMSDWSKLCRSCAEKYSGWGRSRPVKEPRRR